MCKKIILLLLTLLLISTSLNAQADRDKIETKYKWNLTDLFPSVDAWQTEMKNIEGRIDEILKHKGKLGENSSNLLTTLDTYYAIVKDYYRASGYASKLRDQDLGNSENESLAQQASTLGTKISETASFIDPEILLIDPEKIKKFFDEEPNLAKYKMVIDDTQRKRAHTLSEKEEKILASFGLTSGTPYNVYGMFTNAEMPRAEVELSNGETVNLTSSGYVRYRATENREDRAKIFEEFFNNYGEFEKTIGVNLAGHVKGDYVYAKNRNYKTSLESALNNHNIPTSVYANLITEINKNLPTLHRFLKLKKRMLGYDTLHYYDLYTSMVEKVEMKFSVEEGQEAILRALPALGDEYIEVLKEAFNNRWIDYYPNTGKRSGAYSSGSAYDVHPYILMNWTEDFNSVSTLAHELGHTMHSYLSNKNQGFQNANYSIFVAEIASTLNENLLMDYLVANVETEKEKLFLLGSYLETLRTTLFRQVSFAEFEWEIHKKVENNEPLNGEIMSNIYYDIAKKYYGHDEGICEVDPYIAYEWAFIPHFYYNYYVYQYSTSIIYSTALAEKITNAQLQLLEGEVAAASNPAVDDYFK
ncbi:MAG: oligoendopeptidase F, partial [Melioribacteraceae bacterium]|nr:oligoendopeptidase F [Melioribacteraceae bacterium]